MLLTSVAAVAAAAVVAVAFSLEGGRAEPPGDPAAFAVRIVRLVSANRYGPAWDVLHPGQQSSVRRAEYVRCERRSAIPGHVVSVEVVAVRDEEIAVAAVDGRTRSRAVEVRTLIADRVVPEGVAVEQTVHVVPVGGRWAWILPAARLQAYAVGRCPD